MSASRVIAGVFVGGAGTRMGGVPKGLLRAPDGPAIVERSRSALAAAGVTEVVLVGRASAYALLGIEALADEPPGIGPLGGLAALLRRAGQGHALAIACDMPFVSSSLIARLLAAPDAPVVAPRRADRWEPLCARYDAAHVRGVVESHVASGTHSLQRVLDAAGAVALVPEPGDATDLVDWDSPEDVTSHPRA